MPKIVCYQCGTEKEMESDRARFCSGACKLKWNRIAKREKKATVSPELTVSPPTVSPHRITPTDTVAKKKPDCEFCASGRCLRHEKDSHIQPCPCDIHSKPAKAVPDKSKK